MTEVFVWDLTVGGYSRHYTGSLGGFFLFIYTSWWMNVVYKDLMCFIVYGVLFVLLEK